MFDGRVQLVHVFEPKPAMITGGFPATAPATPGIGPDLIERARETHVNALNTLAADGGFPPEQVHFREGHLIRMLPEAASELHADIVVMGAIARSRLQQAIVGNAAEYTLDRFPCDVLIVKPEDFKSPVEAIPPIYGHEEKAG
jgi:universal stress protein E